MDDKTIVALNRKAIAMGKLIIRMTTLAESGHPSSALALTHVVATLMFKQMRYDPKNPWNPASDRLVLSEGHAVPVIYAAYADLGGVFGKSKAEAKTLTPEFCDTLREIDSELDGHPNPNVGFHFFDAATGSLGQGLSAAAGLALAARLDGLDKRIYCIIGDGESREGQIWEAVDFLADHKLSAVTPIFNCNGQGQSDYTSKQQSPETIARKLEAYNLKAVIADGHDQAAIENALNETDLEGRPVAIVLRTQKGWGVSALKDKSNHGKPLTKDQMSAAIAELDVLEKKLPESDGVVLKPQLPTAKDCGCCCGTRAAEIPAALPPCDFDKILAGDSKLLEQLKKKGVATRRIYGIALRELGRANPNVVVLDADVSNSTFSNIFAKEFPNRYFECRIAEQNMLSVAGGLAAAGKIPFVSSFAKFLARAYDQIEMLTITGANVKICGSHAGISLGADGPSQMGVADVAFFRSFASAAACSTLIPADAVAAYNSVKLAAENPGMVYIRTMRPDVPVIYPEDQKFEIGGSCRVIQGDEVIFVSNGFTLHYIKDVVQALRKDGIDAGLVDAYSLPIRSKLIESLTADPGKVIVSVEDNYAGGLGSALAEMAAARRGAKVVCLVCNRIPKSGKTPEDVFAYCGLSRDAIIAAARKAIGK
ncbi:MAG TPA: transketolase [Candidatus Brocadiia bacterium]|nr:transketolase [Candidatus Brocadiia bacterium]